MAAKKRKRKFRDANLEVMRKMKSNKVPSKRKAFKHHFPDCDENYCACRWWGEAK